MRKDVGNLVVTDAMIKSVIEDETLSKSAKMKTLFDWGISVAEIARHLKVSYNFSYNVITNYVASQKLNLDTTNKVTKKDQILELHRQGKSNKEIAQEINANYNYVYNTVRAFKVVQDGKKEVAATILTPLEPLASEPKGGLFRRIFGAR